MSGRLSFDVRITARLCRPSGVLVAAVAVSQQMHASSACARVQPATFSSCLLLAPPFRWLLAVLRRGLLRKAGGAKQKLRDRPVTQYWHRVWSQFMVYSPMLALLCLPIAMRGASTTPVRFGKLCAVCQATQHQLPSKHRDTSSSLASAPPAAPTLAENPMNPLPACFLQRRRLR